MAQQDLFDFLRHNQFTKDLSEEEIKSLLPFIDTEIYKEGDFVFKEGEDGRDLYLVKSGKLEVAKEVEELGGFEQLSTIEAGEFFGEMAHLENEKRSASVRALENVEILSFHLDALQRDPSKKILYSKIIAKLAKKVSQHLRKTDQNLIDSLKERLKILRSHAQISQTLIHIVVLMAVWFNVLLIVQQFPTPYRTTLDPIFTSALLMLFAFSSVIVIKSSGYPLELYGITIKRWLAVSIEATIYSLPIMLFFLLLKWVLVTNVTLFKGLPIFSSMASLKPIMILVIIYIILSPVQELIVRGCIQSCFRNFFQGPNRVFYAILVSNLLFQIFHTVKEFWLAVASLFLGFFWGYLFEKQKSIIGVSISHALIGTWTLFILGYDVLLELVKGTQGR